MCCVKICLTKLLIRRGPDRHQAGAEIRLLEWDLKPFSNHCQLHAVSLRNAADFFLEWDQRGQCFGEQEETEAMPPRKGMQVYAWWHILWKLTEKIYVNLLKMFHSRAAIRRADMLAPHLTWGFLLHLSVTAERKDRRQERNHWDAAFCPAPHLFTQRPCRSPSHPQC